MRTRPLLVAITALLAVALVGCTGAAAGRSPSASRSVTKQAVIPPEPVVQAVFDAARTGEVSKLAELCDPTGNNDQDTEDLCALGEDGAKRHSVEVFRQEFAKGAIRSTEVTGRKATVDFTFGPDGSKPGKMTLVQRDEKWYLAGY